MWVPWFLHHDASGPFCERTQAQTLWIHCMHSPRTHSRKSLRLAPKSSSSPYQKGPLTLQNRLRTTFAFVTARHESVAIGAYIGLEEGINHQNHSSSSHFFRSQAQALVSFLGLSECWPHQWRWCDRCQTHALSVNSVQVRGCLHWAPCFATKERW